MEDNNGKGALFNLRQASRALVDGIVEVDVLPGIQTRAGFSYRLSDPGGAGFIVCCQRDEDRSGLTRSPP